MADPRFDFAWEAPVFSDRVLILRLVDAMSSAPLREQKSCAQHPDSKVVDLATTSLDEAEPHTPSNASELKRININSIMLASDSRFFRAMLTNGMKESHSKELVLDVHDKDEAELIFHLLRFLYTGDLGFKPTSSPDPEQVLQMLLLADRLGIDSAVLACSKMLSDNLALDPCSQILDLPDSLVLNELCGELIVKSRDYLGLHFKTFDALWDGEQFLKLGPKAVAAVLSSDQLQVRCENTIYQAAKRWWQLSPHSHAAAPESSQDVVVASTAVALIHAVRFPFLTPDFLIDVVKCDSTFHALPTVCSTLEKQIGDAMLYHASSGRRRQIDPSLSKLHWSRRLSGNSPQSVSFTWKVENVSKMFEDRYIFSPSFFVDGYYLRLQCGRIRWERSDGFAFALFLSVDLPATGLLCERGFFLHTESQFLARNVRTREFAPTHLPSFDTFTAGVCELGYFDIFKKSWAELTSPESTLVDKDDSLELQVNVKLLV